MWTSRKKKPLLETCVFLHFFFAILDNMYKELVRKSLVKDNVFDSFMNHMETCKKKGHVFEEICKQILTRRGYIVFELSEYPNLDSLKLKRHDLGIDLIAIAPNDTEPIAVQCKFRGSHRRLGWKEFSTFDALCARTGPWKSKLLMTTASGIRIEGERLPSDRVWARAFFKNLSRPEWEFVAGLGPGHVCGGCHTDVREARLRYFDK